MNLRRAVSDALVGLGYRRQGRTHLLRIDQPFAFWVDTGPLGKRSDIAPSVGIRHDEIEDLLARLMALPSDEWVGSVGANVGYVLGRGYQSWTSPASPDEVLQAIDAAVARLRPFLSLERLSEVWELTGIKDPLWRYRDIVIQVLREDRQAVLERLEAAKAAFCVEDDELCQQFRGFEQRTRAFLGLG